MRGRIGLTLAISLAVLLAAAGAPAEQVTRVYWTEWNYYNPDLCVVARAAADGSGVETVIDGLNGDGGPGDLVVDAEAAVLYVGNAPADAIERVNLDGSGRETVVAGTNPEGLALDPVHGKIYWIDARYNGPGIWRADLDGSDVEQIVAASDGSGPYGVVVDAAAGYIFWSERMDQQLYRANLDGSGAWRFLECHDGIGHPRGVALSATRIYWATGESIMSATRDGDDVRVVIEDLDEAPYHIERDAETGRIYWVTQGGMVQRVEADGTGLTTLVDGSQSSNGFALEMGEPVAAPDVLEPALAVAVHPSPFNPRTTITFTTPGPGSVRLDVLDARGRRVRTLASGFLPAGPQRMIWDGCDGAGRPLASGVYLVRVAAGGRSVTGRAVLTR
jgi:hypothetical protein